jgi:hypothetical protein
VKNQALTTKIDAAMASRVFDPVMDGQEPIQIQILMRSSMNFTGVDIENVAERKNSMEMMFPSSQYSVSLLTLCYS